VSVVANVAINVDSRNAVSKLRQVQTQAQSTEKAFGALQSAIGALGVGFALTKVIADVKELDTNLRRLGTVGGNVAALDKGLGALSDRLDGVANKAELAAASYQALSAGFTETGANLRVVEAATKAAVGGMVDVTAATEVTTKVLNAYNMSGDQATKVTDSIAKSIEYGVVQWSDYTSQLGRVASISAVAGVSLDETNAFIAAATKNSATAEIAFTGLGATLSNMLKPTKESADAAKALGINWNLSGIRGEGFESLMGKLGKAMQENPVLANKMVGGQEAVRGAFAAASKGGKDYAMILEGLGGATNKTEQDFQRMKESLVNQLKALDTAFKNLSEALGRVFGPNVVKSITDVAGAINGLADALDLIPEPIAKFLGDAIKLIAQILLLDKAIKGIIGLRVAFNAAMTGMAGATAASGAAAATSASSFALYTNNARAVQAQAATATPVVTGLSKALQSIAAMGIITVAVNIAISGFQSLLAANAELDKLRGRKAAGGAAAMFAGSSKEEVSRQQAIARKTLEHEQKTLKGLQSPGSRVAQFVNLGGVLEGLGVPSIQSAGRREMQAKGRIGSAQAVLGLDPNKFPSATPTLTPTPTPTPTPTTATGTGTGAKKGSDDAERAAEEAKRLAEQIREQTKAAESLKIQQQGSLAILRSSNDFEKAFVEFSVKRTEIQRRYSELTLASKSDEERKLLTEARALEFKQSSFELQKQIADLTKQATAPLDDIASKLKDQVAFEREYGELIKNGTNPELAKQIIEINRAYEASAAALVPALAAAQAAVTRAEAEGASATEIQKYREELERIQEIQSGLPAKKTDAISAATELAAPKTDQQNITEKIGTLKDEIADLTSISNIAITSAEGIGNAFAQSFQGLIDGSMTAKEALGSFFKSVADMFLEMAAQIIAKQITMIILQTILKALGAVAGGGGGGANLTNIEATDFSFNPSAMTGSLTPGGLFAKGGAFTNSIVSSPTMFKFADGGAMRTGLMGEAGPEAIMPLSRGADGSLGVQANGLREAMDRQQGGANGSPVLNMSFQSTSINGVEYVSRDQLESAMAETRRSASRDGAKRGMTMTLDRIQNSSSTRRKVGI
jgi:TP901 family phage tail tape measure protein/lambda family phage tail tape measure protein